MELSKRLYAVAGLVTEGASVADIGTDHGYIPIWLVQNKAVSKVIALDVNEGPLLRARNHIAEYGLTDRIETRLSDGLKNVGTGEADTIIAAGMGGGLIIRILEEGKAAADTCTSFILQPQSEIGKVRRYINGHGMRITEENMIEEDGKYYPMMKAVHGEPEHYEEWEYLYGKRLLEQRSGVLYTYLLREIKIRETILERLQRKNTEKAAERMAELETEIEYAQRALSCYGRKRYVM